MILALHLSNGDISILSLYLSRRDNSVPSPFHWRHTVSVLYIFPGETYCFYPFTFPGETCCSCPVAFPEKNYASPFICLGETYCLLRVDTGTLFLSLKLFRGDILLMSSPFQGRHIVDVLTFPGETYCVLLLIQNVLNELIWSYQHGYLDWNNNNIESFLTG